MGGRASVEGEGAKRIFFNQWNLLSPVHLLFPQMTKPKSFQDKSTVRRCKFWFSVRQDRSWGYAASATKRKLIRRSDTSAFLLHVGHIELESLIMADLVSFLISIFTLFLQLAGDTNANSSASFTITAYWNEVFPGTPMPDALRVLLPSSTQISGLAGRGYSNMDIDATYKRAWGRIWGALSHGHNTFDRSNRSPDLAPLYFLRNDLLSGSKMNVTMMINSAEDHASAGEPTFLPRKRAQEIPFSTSNLTTILKLFSIDPDSEHAFLTRQTLFDCEVPAHRGEAKYCATSLESMIDFVVAEFGTTDIRAVSTSAANREEEVKGRSYRVGDGGGRLMSRKIVSCHNMMFPFSVFYCHNFAGTRAYMVPLIADDGSRVNAIALCHFDTSSWNPGHASFQVLGVKPGTVPICHFILQDLAWIPNGSA